MKIILSFLFTTILLYTLIGQCTVEGSISSENIACNDCVTLSANGFGENTSAFTENFNSGQPVGWDFTQTVTISASTCGIPSLDGSQFMWMGNSSPAPRTMATVGLDVSSGGNVCFEMRYAIQEDPSPCEGPDLGDEGVTLQYSINNGASWNTINYWPPLNGGAPSSMTVWNQYCENIPVAAQTTNTMFRWTQLEATSEIYDHWGMDNVEISLVTTNYNMTWLHDNYSYGEGNYTGENPVQACPAEDTIYVIEMTDGENFCYDTVFVSVDFPEIDNISVLNPFCGGINGEIEITAFGGTPDYQFSIDNGSNFQSSGSFTELDTLLYNIIIVDENDCIDTAQVLLEGVDSLFIVNLIVENTTCGNENGTISFDGTGGTPGYQYSIDSGLSYMSSSQFEQNNPGIYELVILDSEGCTNQESVEILPSTNPQIDTVMVTDDYCGLVNGTIDAFVSLGVTPYSYFIFLENDTISVNSIGTFENLNWGSYELIVVDSLNCSTSADFLIDEIPAPIVDLTDTALCNLSFQIENIVSFTGSQWSASSTNITFDNELNTNPSLEASEPGIYTIAYQDTVCNTQASFQIEFIPDPYTEVLDTLLCIGENYKLIALTADQNTGYLWDNGSIENSIDINQTNYYWVTASNSCGIYTDSAYIVFYDCDLNVPNVFTPNNDGNNDYFELIDFQGIKTFNCHIYNRWGNLIRTFEQANFAWDGNILNGNEAEDGVYFYLIKATTNGGKAINKHGNIHLIRND